MSEQADLFGSAPIAARAIAEESRFGCLDARCGLPLRNHYSSQLDGSRLIAYETGYRRGLRALHADALEREVE